MADGMQIHVNPGNAVTTDAALASDVQATLTSALDRYANQITRIEVHLSDENAHKGGPTDKRCLVEVKVEGRPPTAVSHLAPSFEEAIAGAADKALSALDRQLGKLRGY